MNNLEELVNKTNISAFVTTSDFVKGKEYNINKIDLVEEGESQGLNGKIKYYFFEVDSETKPTYYDVKIIIENNKRIVRTICDCKQYQNFHSCKHVAAAIIHNYELLFNSVVVDLQNVSMSILDFFLVQEDTVIKKELNLSLNIEVNNEISAYYYQTAKLCNIKLMIGENKMYIMGNHEQSFRRAYENGEGEVYFGKSLLYDPRKYYFSKENEEMLNILFNSFNSLGNVYLNTVYIKKLLNKLKDISFTINNYQVDGIKDTFPIDTNLIRNNQDYELEFDLDKIESIIDDDFEYILYKGCLYHLNEKEQKLLSELSYLNLNKILIKKDNLDRFTNGLLKTVRKKLNIDSSITEITLPTSIKTKLYFDIRNESILANMKFDYDNKEIDYFDNSQEILRDKNYESDILNELISCGFKIDKKKIILDDVDLEVEFLENGLEKLALKYEIFTTEKFKGIKINKKMNITSMFGIGKDNILSYNFNLGDINSDELVNIFSDLKKKKKYYRLKNGDILSLNDESLQELSNLTEELELSDDDIINGKGSVLKYRAIYLDSLKKTKYNIINTDNLFDNFINKFNEYKNVELTLDKKDLSILRDYQLTGVKWLYNLACTGFGGILADEMGLGKTIQVIYYIKQMLKDNSSAKFLIVVPTSLAYNWEHEFDMYGNSIQKVICVGAKEKRINILHNIDDFNVIITTYGLLREDEDLYLDLSFNTMIIDEAQNIKNYMSGIAKVVKKINAETKFALTGTPLENSILELWSIFDFIMPGYLSSLTKFQKKYKIKDFDEDGEKLIKGLSKQINPFILRRLKKDVVKELPDKLTNDIYIDLKDEQKKLYVAELEKVKKEMEEVINSDGISKARFLILQLLTKLRQICIDPSIIYDNYEDGSNKIEQLVNITKEYIDNNHKILVFSSFKTALNIVKSNLEKEKIKTFMIDGSVSSKDRMMMVNNFNENDDVKVFLIMLKSGGTGLNLTSADVVIHLDLWWNPQAENQASDRAHRIGQTKTVEVIHLITKGTIEEKILELQKKKLLLSEKLIDGEVRDKNIISSLTEEDIRNLLTYENKE